jgi:hypothetical protein
VEEENHAAHAELGAFAQARDDVVGRAAIAAGGKPPSGAGEPALGQRARRVDLIAPLDQRQDDLPR